MPYENHYCAMLDFRLVKLVSFIFPIFNEEGNIDELYHQMSQLVAKQQFRSEFIFVNDGSSDTSLEKLLTLHERDERVVVISLSRNWGHQLAVTAGLDRAEGDAVVIMDSDLQDPPEVALELIKTWQTGEYDVVYAQRRSRQDTVFKRFTADAFYRILQKLSDIDIPRNTGDFRLLDRKVVLELRKYREHDRFLRGMVSYVGFRQIAVSFDRHARHAGKTGYPLKKMIRFATDGIIGFSDRPLRLISHVGIAVSLLSVIGIIYALLRKLLAPEEVVSGWTFTIIAIMFVGGVQMIMLGILGTYMARIYNQVKGRPLYGIGMVACRGVADVHQGESVTTTGSSTVPPTNDTESASNVGTVLTNS